MKQTTAKAWKLYGMDGHKQEESYAKSYKIDLSDDRQVRIYEVINSDKIHTNMFSVVKITANSLEDCCKELDAQIDTGLFMNLKIGKVEEIELEDLEELISDSSKSWE